jgi:hypothetical protein
MMTPVEAAPAAPALAEAVRAKFRDAAAPMTLKEVAKGLPKPEKMKPAALQAEVRRVLGEEVSQGRAFTCLSGRKGEERFWTKDERNLLREKAIELAATPQPLSKLKTALGKVVRGTDGAFLESVARELVFEGRLFEHPAKSEKSGPLFATTAPPPPPPPLEELIRAGLQEAPAPLSAREAAKGLPNPRKLKAAELEAEVRKALDGEVSQGLAFSAPSGKKGEARYWSKDEKHLLRERAIELCATPQPLSTLQKQLAQAGTKADAGFSEAVVRELVAEDRLFEHPGRGKKGGPLFGTSQPPPEVPPLEREPHQKKVAQLVKTCRDLMAKAGITADDLLGVIRAQLAADGARSAAEPTKADAPPSLSAEAAPVLSAPEAPSARPRVEELILQAVSVTPVLSLADLRREMPPGLQGKAFDEAVLRLADEQRVLLSQDSEPTSFSEAERVGYVRDGLIWFTTIMQRS